MTAASPWSVKGIDPKAREVAKDLARRSGLTLGEWLNQMIIDGGADAPPFEPEPIRDSGYRGIPARDFNERHEYGIQGRDFTPPRDTPSRDFTPPVEHFRATTQKSAELQRVTQALDQLSARMEAAEHRSTLAISGIDQSVMGVLSRLEAVERDHNSVAARFDGALEDVRQAQSKVSERMRRLADEDAPRIEAMKALEGALGKVAEKLYESETNTRATLNDLREDVSNVSRRVDKAETRIDAEPAAAMIDGVVAKIVARLEQAESKTSEAVRGLEQSFAGLNARLNASETQTRTDGDGLERRFERLTIDLSHKVEASRAEIAERLSHAADGKLDRMEGAVRRLANHVEEGERRSAAAIDRMGREVMEIANTLQERVARVETRSAESVEQMGGEMARIAEAIEQRMGQQDSLQAQALERLGGEITRIAEKLAERIANTERRSTQSIDDVGDQLGRVTERLDQRYDKAQSELADRIQDSEARTARMLEDAQAKIETHLAETRSRAAMEAAAEAERRVAEVEIEAPPLPVIEPPEPALPFGMASFAELETPPPAETFTSDPFAFEPLSAIPEPPPFIVHAPMAPPPSLLETTEHLDAEEPAGDELGGRGGFEAERAFAGLADEVFSPQAGHADQDAGLFDPPTVGDVAEEEDPHPATRSTRKMLEAARIATRKSAGRRADPLADAVDAPPLESEGRTLGFGINRKKKDGVSLRTALVASGTAAAIAVTWAGAELLTKSEMAAGPEHRAEHFGVAPTAAAQNEASLPAGSQPAPATAQMAVALTPPPGQIEGLKGAVDGKIKPAPGPISATVAPPPVVTPPAPAAAALYSAAVRKIESGDQSGVEDLKRAANLGHAPAQFYLAKLYETGGGGLKKDLSEARRWTERAAGGGDVAAMHNLGLYYYEGEAGPQDPAKAAQWFRKAADEGVKDSQYNLALLYAKGYGVAQNPAEAYKWYLIAAAAGDDGAKTAAQGLRAQLTPDAQAAAEHAAAAFHAQAAPVRTASTGTATSNP